jgi:hypothetical protein
VSFDVPDDLSTVPNEEIVGALMQHILDKIVAVFDQAQVDLPARRYIHIGATAHDCEQLTISFLQMYAGPPGIRANEPQKCNSPRTAVFTVQLVRPAPLPEGRTQPPSIQSFYSHTLEKTRDAWLLMDAAMMAVDDYIGVIADVAVTPPSDYQAIVLNLSVGIP